MNRLHRLLCRSALWRWQVDRTLLPWALDDVPLGVATLEIGPGFGATTESLARRAAALTAVEVDAASARRLHARFGRDVRIVHGDGTAMSLPDKDFDSVVCFTMLHHVPSPQAQDQLFAEALRVLRPGGVFAGSDSLPSAAFRLAHLGDTMVTVDPDGLPDRLRAVGFDDVHIEIGRGSFRFRATRG